MKRIILSHISVIILVMSWAPLACAELVVVANKSIDTVELSKKAVVDIYMGRYPFFPNGEKVIPLDHGSDSEYKKSFYSKLVNKNLSEIKAYWTRLLFSGRAIPPLAVNTEQEMIEMIVNNPAMIGYIHLGSVTDDVKVILHVE